MLGVDEGRGQGLQLLCVDGVSGWGLGRLVVAAP